MAPTKDSPAFVDRIVLKHGVFDSVLDFLDCEVVVSAAAAAVDDNEIENDCCCCCCYCHYYHNCFAVTIFASFHWDNLLPWRYWVFQYWYEDTGQRKRNL